MQSYGEARQPYPRRRRKPAGKVSRDIVGRSTLNGISARRQTRDDQESEGGAGCYFVEIAPAFHAGDP